MEKNACETRKENAMLWDSMASIEQIQRRV